MSSDQVNTAPEDTSEAAPETPAAEVAETTDVNPSEAESSTEAETSNEATAAEETSPEETAPAEAEQTEQLAETDAAPAEAEQTEQLADTDAAPAETEAPAEPAEPEAAEAKNENPVANMEPPTPRVALVAPDLSDLPDDIGDDFEAAIAATVLEFNDGDIVEGTVVSVDGDGAMIDVGYKSEGLIPTRELSIRNNIDPHDSVKVGDRVEAVVLTKEDDEGRLLLSKKRAM
jgi:transcriptional accessory protein Tex/SPT6